MSANFGAFVSDILSAYSNRQAFFTNPFDYIRDWEKAHANLDPEEKAIFFAMDRVLLADWIVEKGGPDLNDEIMKYSFTADGTWPPGADPCPAAGGAAAVSSPTTEAAAAGWTDPRPEIWSVTPATGHTGQKVQLQIEAEGVCEDAQLVLWRRSPDAGRKIYHFTTSIVGVSSFRRLCVRSTLDLNGVSPGTYSVALRNAISSPTVRSLHPP
jgi:hypothetical protein